MDHGTRPSRVEHGRPRSKWMWGNRDEVVQWLVWIGGSGTRASRRLNQDGAVRIQALSWCGRWRRWSTRRCAAARCAAAACGSTGAARVAGTRESGWAGRWHPARPCARAGGTESTRAASEAGALAAEEGGAWRWRLEAGSVPRDPDKEEAGRSGSGPGGELQGLGRRRSLASSDGGHPWREGAWRRGTWATGRRTPARETGWRRLMLRPARHPREAAVASSALAAMAARCSWFLSMQGRERDLRELRHGRREGKEEEQGRGGGASWCSGGARAVEAEALGPGRGARW